MVKHTKINAEAVVVCRDVWGLDVEDNLAWRVDTLNPKP